jgi:hypothetical protein
MSNLTTTTATEEKALALLGQGFDPSVVASACGVSPSRISQLLSREDFAEVVALKRYEALQKNNLRDQKYDDLEDGLLAKLEGSLAMVFDPLKIARLLMVVNQAKRRGAATPESITQRSPTATLNVPTLLINHFSTQLNVNNQVVQIVDASKNHSQSLVTIQSNALDALRNAHGNAKLLPETSSG